MPIISTSQINTIIPSQQLNTICPFHRYTQCDIFSDRHTISSFLIYINYILFREIQICSSDKHTIFSSHKCTSHHLPGKYTTSFSDKCTLFPLHRITHFNLFLEKHIISLSLYPILTNTIIYSPEINTLHSLHWNAHILFSDKNNKSLSVICPRYTQYIIFSDRHTISSFLAHKLYPSHKNTHILFSTQHTISLLR
jgi:hypothetical protein